jgi:hypothetical protein
MLLKDLLKTLIGFVAFQGFLDATVLWLNN